MSAKINVNSSTRFTILKAILIPLIAATLLLSACATSTTASRLPDPEEVKSLLFQLVDVEKRAPGIVVGMIANDPPERWVVGYGRLSASDPRVPDGDTVFEIGSITKGFTGILLAQAVVNDEVQLDDPISMYLPEGVTAPEYEGQPITLLNLAMHTSGLPPFDTTDLSQDYTLKEMYDFLSGYRLTHAPGSIYDYSNLGYGLLGDLLARSAGLADYEALLLERICLPLGMDSTRIQLTPEMSARLAAPNFNLVQNKSFARSAFNAGGGIRSTANDMLTFLAANMGQSGTELQPAIQLAKQPFLQVSGIQSYGLDWYILWDTYMHPGRTLGYYSILAWDPQRQIGVVVLSNDSEISIEDIGFQLLLGITSGRQVPRSIEITLTTWAILTVGCLAFLIWELWRRQPAPRGARLMWILTTVFLGPVGLVIYWFSAGKALNSGTPVEQVPTVRRALGSTAWAATGCALGGIGVLALQRYLPEVFSPNPVLLITTALLLPLFVEWFILAVSKWISQSTAAHDLYSRRPLFVEVVSTCLVLTGLFPVVFYLMMRWFNFWTYGRPWDLLYPPLWGALCLGAIAGTLVTYPFHLWMIRRSLFRWGTVAILNAPTRELAWYVKVVLVLLSLVTMLGAMFLSMQIAQG